MYRKVLVPMDGSERAEAILPHVQEIAQNHKAKIIFLRVLEPPHPVVSPDGIYVPSKEIVEEHKQEVEDYLKHHQAKFQELGFNAEIRVAYGRVVDEICNIAKEEDVDLVALASHGRTGLAQVFFGSVAIGVLHRLTRPVLLVRSEE